MTDYKDTWEGVNDSHEWIQRTYEEGIATFRCPACGQEFDHYHYEETVSQAMIREDIFPHCE